MPVAEKTKINTNCCMRCKVYAKILCGGNAVNALRQVAENLRLRQTDVFETFQIVAVPISYKFVDQWKISLNCPD